jgi:hypothetical protein
MGNGLEQIAARRGLLPAGVRLDVTEGKQQINII